MQIAIGPFPKGTLIDAVGPSEAFAIAESAAARNVCAPYPYRRLDDPTLRGLAVLVPQSAATTTPVPARTPPAHLRDPRTQTAGRRPSREGRRS